MCKRFFVFMLQIDVRENGELTFFIFSCIL